MTTLQTDDPFSALLNQRLNPALVAQLRALGLSTEPPTAGQWADFLRAMSDALAVQHRSDSAPNRIAGVDLTEPDSAWEAAAQPTGRYAQLVEASPLATAVLGAGNLVLDANDALLALIGVTPDALIGHPLSALELSPVAGGPPLAELSAPLTNLGVHLVNRQGARLNLLASATWIELDGERSILLQLVDVTEQVRAEADLRASEARYRDVLIAVERQARETALLDQVRTVMAHEVDLQSVIRAVVNAIREYFGYDLISIYLRDGAELVLQHEVGYQGAFARIPLVTGVMARSVRERTSILLTDVSGDPDFLSAIPNIRAEIAVPLFVADEPQGVLNVETVDDSLTAHDLDLLEAIGAHVSVAIQRARLLAELQASNDRYDSLLRSVQEVVFQTDGDGAWVYLNPTWERLSGYSVESMLSQHWWDVVHPDDRLRLNLQFARMIRRRKPYFQFTARFITSRGDERWCELSGRLSYTEAGRFAGCTGTASDIHERHLAEEREREQRELAEALVANAAGLAGATSADEALKSTLAHISRIIPEFDALRAALIEDGMAQMVSFPPPGRPDERANQVRVWDIQTQHLPLIDAAEPPTSAVVVQHLAEGIPLPGLEWVRSAIIAPLRSKDQILGYLCLDSERAAAFTDQQAGWLQGVANQMGTALHNLRLRADMARYAQELELRVAERTDQYRQTKEQVETILNTSSDPIALVTTSGQILQANRAFTHVFEAGARNPTPPPIASFMSGDSGAALLGAIEAALHGEPQRVRLTARRADGSLFPVDAAVDSLLESAQPQRTAVCSLHDITEHQILEDSLRAALEQERRLVDLKSRFGMMVSHEFRTPLATIQTSTDLLSKYFDRLSAERRSEALETIARQVRHLTTMLDDILAISKADTIGLEFRPAPTDLAELCQSIVEEIRWLDRDRHPIHCAVENVTARLNLDRALLQRSLMNLLTNATKYSPDASAVELLARQDHGLIHFVIRDHGIGIPPREVPRLFETFFRASNVGIVPGTGLGLAIARRAIEAHGGQISAESELGRGTTFTIDLPAVMA